jgi:F-type H+-transporting ATPase subunit delta
MGEIKISRRYARALFDVGVESKQLETFYKDMLELEAIVKESSDFRNFLRTPIIKAKKKQQVLTEIFAGKVNEVTVTFLHIITQGGREALMQSIAEQYIALYKDLKNIKTARLETVTPMDAATKAKLINTLEDYTKSTIELEEVQNDSLIGGFVLELEDMKLENSVRAKLNKYHRELVEK